MSSNRASHISPFVVRILAVLAVTPWVQSCDLPRGEEDAPDYIPSAIEQALLHQDPAVRWQSQSLLIVSLRASGDYARLTELLEQRTANEMNPEIVSQARLALVQNELLEGRPERAISRLDEMPSLRATSFVVQALRLRAAAQSALGNRKAAMEALAGIVQHAPEGRAAGEARYRLAELEASVGNVEEAERLLRANLAASSQLGPHMLGASKYLLEQLAKARGPAYRTVDELIESLASAFKRGAPERLSALLDPRHFVAGPVGSPPIPRDRAWLESLFRESVRRGLRPTLPLPPVRLTEEPDSEILVLSYDWLGKPSLDAWIRLSRHPDGWRWDALRFIAPPGSSNRPPIRKAAVDLPGEGHLAMAQFALEGPASLDVGGFGMQAELACPAAAGAPPDGLPLAFGLRAPWASAQSMLAGSWFLADPTPVVGGECTDLVGWPGQYYMEGNHGNNPEENYAIDFIRWGTRWGACPIPFPPFVVPCVWPWPSPGNTVVSVSQGRVSSVETVFNTVTVDHLDSGGTPTGYRSEYLHMIPVLVQEGQFVARGTPLGIVGAQGTAEAHLHFHLLRNTGGGFQPVMPSPMEGITLGWCGTRQCIRSSNVDTFNDEDGDGVLDTFDNCPGVPNPFVMNADGNLEQPDVNGDGWGDACSCASDADCSGSAYCNSSGRPPSCRIPICVDDNDCPGPTRCLGSGSTAQCSTPANVMDCSDVQYECLIGFEGLAPASSCISLQYELSGEPTGLPGDDPCNGVRRYPASAHEAECLSAAQQIVSHIHCLVPH